jgi:two-component system nitrogen regulation response regulator GlnG
VLVPDFLPSYLLAQEKAAASTAPDVKDIQRFVKERLQAGSTALYAEWLAVVERDLLTEVLRHTSGNQAQAAKLLGISRNNLRTKLRALGLKTDRAGSAEDE